MMENPSVTRLLVEEQGWSVWCRTSTAQLVRPEKLSVCTLPLVAITTSVRGLMEPALHLSIVIRVPTPVQMMTTDYQSAILEILALESTALSPRITMNFTVRMTLQMELLCAFILPNTTAMTLPAQESKPSTKLSSIVTKVPTDVDLMLQEHRYALILLVGPGWIVQARSTRTFIAITETVELQFAWSLL